MLTTSQCIHAKLISFFNQYNDERKRHMYKVLTIELDILLTQTMALDSAQLDLVVAQQHKLKGICRYLKIENETIEFATENKSELVASTLILQQLLNDIESEM
ncbi:hypothetical protein C9J47_19430 [Photobacterium indicum]|jgi:septum formation topological specificity factor MinE|uniref:Phosphorelay protein LuxU n=2 Tax=Photobacterium indicum TaxID=81447 RepID=A0A2T3L587_9GAMM|nr:hypothetical protein C9J47_19430 [Photobacterium indicum]